MKVWEKHTILRSFEFSIMDLEDNNSPHYFLQREDRRSSPLPLVNVRIDFEHGNFFLEGSWMFMTASNKKVRKRREAGKQERERVESALYPYLPLDLTDEKSENYHLSLYGMGQDYDVI